VSETTMLRYEWLADRRWTFSGWSGQPNAGSVLTGYVRLGEPEPCGSHGTMLWRLGVRHWAAARSGQPCWRLTSAGFTTVNVAALVAKGGGWRRSSTSEDRGMRIKIRRRCGATFVAPIHCVWQGVLRLPAEPVATQPTPSADRCHMRIVTVRAGLTGRGS
jgi:hypothetical protein